MLLYIMIMKVMKIIVEVNNNVDTNNKIEDFHQDDDINVVETVHDCVSEKNEDTNMINVDEEKYM